MGSSNTNPVAGRFKWYYDKSLPLDFWSVSHRISKRNKNTVYRLQISVLVPEIFKFEKCVKYANEMTDDVIYSTQFYIMYINRAILANLRPRALKLDRGYCWFFYNFPNDKKNDCATANFLITSCTQTFSTG